MKVPVQLQHGVSCKLTGNLQMQINFLTTIRPPPVVHCAHKQETSALDSSLNNDLICHSFDLRSALKHNAFHFFTASKMRFFWEEFTSFDMSSDFKRIHPHPTTHLQRL